MHLSADQIDICRLEPNALQRIYDQLTKYGLIGSTRPNTVPTDCIQSNRRAVSVSGENDRERSEAVFEDGHLVLQVTLELHAELRDTATGHDCDHRCHPGLNQAGGHYQGRNRSCAEVLDVEAGRPSGSHRFCNRLTEVPSTPLVAITDGFLRTADDEVNAVRIDVRSSDAIGQGECR